jgi:hypothetical protein
MTTEGRKEDGKSDEHVNVLSVLKSAKRELSNRPLSFPSLTPTSSSLRDRKPHCLSLLLTQEQNLAVNHVLYEAALNFWLQYYHL